MSDWKTVSSKRTAWGEVKTISTMSVETGTLVRTRVHSGDGYDRTFSETETLQVGVWSEPYYPTTPPWDNSDTPY